MVEVDYGRKYAENIVLMAKTRKALLDIKKIVKGERIDFEYRQINDHDF